MGNWRIVIEGVGPHHNDVNHVDADQYGKNLCRYLKGAGHTLHTSTFEVGIAIDFVGGENRVIEYGPPEPLLP